MEQIEKLLELANSAKTNAEAFYGKGNKAAGSRLRKDAMDIKNLCGEIRKNVSEKKNA